MSRVDVVVPCYNYGRFLRECVTSVLTQQCVDVRVLIIDDCSSDNTPHIAASLVAEDSRVEYRRHGVNRGHVATYNEGLLEWTSADYCLLLSADDLLAPGALERSAVIFAQHSEVGLVYGDAPKIQHTPQNSGGAASPYRIEIMTGHEFLELSCREADNIVPTPTAVVRTNLQHRIGGYRADLPHSCDMEMWLRIAAHAAVARVHGTQGYYRLHGQNMSVGYAGVRDLTSRRAAFNALFQTCGDLVPDRDRLSILANQMLAEISFWRASECFESREPELCDAYLKLAREYFPQIQQAGQWRRLRIKRALGVHAWAIFAVFLRSLRRRLMRRPQPL